MVRILTDEEVRTQEILSKWVNEKFIDRKPWIEKTLDPNAPEDVKTLFEKWNKSLESFKESNNINIE